MMSVFCDLSKAFDVIDHTILSAKLEYYGFRGIVKQILADYVSNRTQFVEFKVINEIHVLLSVESLKSQYWDHFFI